MFCFTFIYYFKLIKVMNINSHKLHMKSLSDTVFTVNYNELILIKMFTSEKRSSLYSLI